MIVMKVKLLTSNLNFLPLLALVSTFFLAFFLNFCISIHFRDTSDISSDKDILDLSISSRALE